MNFGGSSSSLTSTAHSSPSSPIPSDNSSPKPFLRTNVVSIKQSSLDETILEYPVDFQDDSTRNSFQLIIDQAKSKREKKLLQNLSLRYSSAINNERVSEVKSLLTSSDPVGTNSSNYRKNFIIDAEKVRDLSDAELMVIINRMMEEKKAVPVHHLS